MEIGFTEQLPRMYEVYFADVQSLDKGRSLEDARAVAVVQSGTPILDGHFGVPISRSIVAKPG